MQTVHVLLYSNTQYISMHNQTKLYSSDKIMKIITTNMNSDLIYHLYLNQHNMKRTLIFTLHSFSKQHNVFVFNTKTCHIAYHVYVCIYTMYLLRVFMLEINLPSKPYNSNILKIFIYLLN